MGSREVLNDIRGGHQEKVYIGLEFRSDEPGVVRLPKNEVFHSDSEEIDEGLLLRLSFSLLDSMNVQSDPSDPNKLPGGEIISGWRLDGDQVVFNPMVMRKDFYSRYPDVDDRTFLLIPEYKEMMLASDGDLKLMSPTVLKLFNAIHENQDKTGVFGIPFSQLLGKGWQIIERSVFEAKPWPVAKSFAVQLRQRIDDHYGRLSDDHMPVPISELGTGAGTTTFALAVHIPGLSTVEVRTFEKEQVMWELLLHNLRLPIPGMEQFRSSIKVLGDNVVDVLRETNGTSPREFGIYRTAAIFADPPWRAAFASKDVKCSNMREMFFMSTRGELQLDLKPAKIAKILKKIQNSTIAERLPRLLDKGEEGYDLWTAEDVVSVVFSKNIAPLISFHVPSKGFDFESLKDSAARLHCNVEIIKHIGKDGARHLEEVQVIFYKSDASIPLITETVVHF